MMLTMLPIQGVNRVLTGC